MPLSRMNRSDFLFTQLLITLLCIEKTLSKALRTQALTALTSNFGSVGLVQLDSIADSVFVKIG